MTREIWANILVSAGPYQFVIETADFREGKKPGEKSRLLVFGGAGFNGQVDESGTQNLNRQKTKVNFV